MLSRERILSRQPLRLGFILAAVASLASASCGDDDDDDDDGTSARGGSSASGGKAGKGGKAGASGKAGTSGKGGAGSGGTAGTAGSKGGSGGSKAGAGGSLAGEAGEAGEGGEAGGGAGGEASLLADPCRGLEIPEAERFVADGLCVRAIATDQGKLRQIAFTSNGDLIGVTGAGEIRRYRDVDGDGAFLSSGDIVVLGSTGGENGNNAHVDEAAGYLYAGTATGVARWPYAAASTALGTREDVVVNQPSTGTHTMHTVHVYDGFLYVHSGSEANAVAPAAPDYDSNRSVLKRFNLSTFSAGTPLEWANGEVVVRGIRNMVGFTRNAAGRMYGVVNGMDNLMYGADDVHLDNPGEDLIRIESGAAHGYPYCFTAQHVLDDNDQPIAAGTQLVSTIDNAASDPDFTNPNDQEFCDENSDEPETFLPAHTAPLDIAFFDGPSGNLPEAWRGGAFVTLHGSWNTTPSVGHSVVYVPFDDEGDAPMPVATATGATFPFTVVFGGGSDTTHTDGIWGWSNGNVGEDPVRPVGVAISPTDGALYVSSDNAQVSGGPTSLMQGVLYRIGIERE
jgi:glucose/arabinose dehydrogenase